ncbi:MAG: GNAT family N-acetyltransferase [Ilumatobacteraceae bacterium]|jgi:predicted GNAT superfamily acetyltransferase
MSPGARVRTASDVRIRLVEDREGARLAAEVADRVWGMTAMVPTEIVIAAVHAGGYAAVLWEDDEPVGSAFGFLGHWHDGRLSLHSHLAGVLPARAGRGHGEALKRHQWRWARERGLEAITWTFDPLVRRNAVFNLVKLGARVTAYHEDFYGEIHDGINAGERTDRLVVRWEVAGDGAAGHGGADGDGPRGDWAAPTARLVPTPEDVESLRRTDRAAAARWREEQRTALRAALADGLAIVGVTRPGEYALAPRGAGA